MSVVVRGRSASSNIFSGKFNDSVAASAALRLGFRRRSFKLLVDEVSIDASGALTAMVAARREDRRRGLSEGASSVSFGELILKLLDIFATQARIMW